MMLSEWFRAPHVGRPLALASVVLAMGGLVLHRASAHGSAMTHTHRGTAPLVGRNGATFAGPGLRGGVSLSHAYVGLGTPTTVYAEVVLRADAEDLVRARARAPISLAVVLDTSGSMEGEKLADAKSAVSRLLSQMHDDDEIALVRYSDEGTLVQPLAEVGQVRADLASRIERIEASGGTNIPSGLQRGLQALAASESGRVKRIIVVSDGLDATRARAEELSRRAFRTGVTVSSLGIGLDFDESYMASIAADGHGNFAFVEDGSALSAFLERELEETSRTIVEGARVRLALPPGVRIASVSGADVEPSDEGVELSFGSLFVGDERRAVVELSVDGVARDPVASVRTDASWTLASCDRARAACGTLSSVAAPIPVRFTRNLALVEQGRDGRVLASAASVLASRRQIDAANAYARGDVAGASRIVEENEAALERAMPNAPPELARSLAAQLTGYREAKGEFSRVSPGASRGRAAAKAAVAQEMGNLSRRAW